MVGARVGCVHSSDDLAFRFPFVAIPINSCSGTLRCSTCSMKIVFLSLTNHSIIYVCGKMFHTRNLRCVCVNTRAKMSHVSVPTNFNSITCDCQSTPKADSIKTTKNKSAVQWLMFSTCSNLPNPQMRTELSASLNILPSGDKVFRMDYNLFRACNEKAHPEVAGFRKHSTLLFTSPSPLSSSNDPTLKTN